MLRKRTGQNFQLACEAARVSLVAGSLKKFSENGQLDFSHGMGFGRHRIFEKDLTAPKRKSSEQSTCVLVLEF
jgi:hypothetical protein